MRMAVVLGLVSRRVRINHHAADRVFHPLPALLARGSAAASIMAAAGTESETHIDIGPPIAWGLGAFAILMLLLIITLTFGRGRT